MYTPSPDHPFAPAPLFVTFRSSVADHDDDFSGIRSFSFSSSGPGGFQQQQQGMGGRAGGGTGGGIPGGFFGMPSFGGFGGMPGLGGMHGMGAGGGVGFDRKEPPVVRDIGLTLVCSGVS